MKIFCQLLCFVTFFPMVSHAQDQFDPDVLEATCVWERFKLAVELKAASVSAGIDSNKANQFIIKALQKHKSDEVSFDKDLKGFGEMIGSGGIAMAGAYLIQHATKLDKKLPGKAYNYLWSVIKDDGYLERSLSHITNVSNLRIKPLATVVRDQIEIQEGQSFFDFFNDTEMNETYQKFMQERKSSQYVYRNIMRRIFGIEPEREPKSFVTSVTRDNFLEAADLLDQWLVNPANQTEMRRAMAATFGKSAATTAAIRKVLVDDMLKKESQNIKLIDKTGKILWIGGFVVLIVAGVYNMYAEHEPVKLTNDDVLSMDPNEFSNFISDPDQSEFLQSIVENDDIGCQSARGLN